MASSAEKPHHHLSAVLTPVGATATPPPTPSTQPNQPSETSASDFLSHLLRRFPPTLSLSTPTRRPSPLSSSSAAPLLTLSDPDPSSSLLSAATQFGFFHLNHHRIPAHLPVAAESAAISLFSLPRHQKKLLFPQKFPLGHHPEDDDSASESFCLDSSCSAVATVAEVDLGSLREFSREMERLGLEVLDKLAGAVGFEKPARNELCSLMWISDGVNKPGRFYPYVLGLQYQIRCQKLSLSPDSGLVTVSGQADSVFITIGDIAQVWSNGKMKKVIGRPNPSLSDDYNRDSHCITMSLLITLPMESTVSPLVPNLVEDKECEKCNSAESDDGE
ncbi:hypothetical protein CASFOL_023574 [Castilleja foliolosa]|uniref:Uncharacterized protein n=1 Tax=Castilleja foliolosa TaxID=1961234 RepID=A0ABD3CKZ3_9LAMI